MRTRIRAVRRREARYSRLPREDLALPSPLLLVPLGLQRLLSASRIKDPSSAA